MKPFIFFPLAILAFICTKAQTDTLSTKKTKEYFVTLETIEGKKNIGLLQRIDKNMFILSQNQIPKSKSQNKIQNQTPQSFSFSIDQIQSVTIKRKNSALRGTLIGAGIGFLTGVIVGLASGSDPVQNYPAPADDPYGLGTLFVGINNAFAMTAGQKALVLGGIGTSIGAGIGAIIGAVVKKKFIIGGQKEKYNDMQINVLDMVYGNQKK